MTRRSAPALTRGIHAPTAKGASGTLAAGISTAPTLRGRRTRAALVSAAREAFEELGFRDARISDITERAGTSYGVFYHHFDSKESILHELMIVVTGEMYIASQAQHVDSADPVDRIRAANRAYLHVAVRNAQLVATIDELAVRDPKFRELKLRIREPFIRRNEAGIRRLQDRGLADQALDAALAASVLGGMIEHFTTLWFVYGVEYDEDLAVETLTRMWAQSIGLRL
jgi:AcrR family transcriptional regulator